MKIKTSELDLAAIDYLVGNITGNKWSRFTPSTDWSQGGPIIERESINLTASVEKDWIAHKGLGWDFEYDPVRGPTPLVAAMRCFIASKLGDVVEVPEELL